MDSVKKRSRTHVSQLDCESGMLVGSAVPVCWAGPACLPRGWRKDKVSPPMAGRPPINYQWTMPPMSCGPAAMCFLEFSGNLQHTRHHVMTNPGSREDNKTHYLYALPHWLNAPGPARVRRFLFILFNRQFTSQEEAPASTALTTSQHDGGLTALARLRWRLSTTTRLHPTDSGPSTF